MKNMRTLRHEEAELMARKYDILAELPAHKSTSKKGRRLRSELRDINNALDSVSELIMARQRDNATRNKFISRKRKPRGSRICLY